MNSLLREYAVAIVSLVCAVTFFWLYDLITSDSYVIGSGSIIYEDGSLGMGAVFSAEEGSMRGSQNTDGGVWGANTSNDYVPHVKIDVNDYNMNDAKDCFLLDRQYAESKTVAGVTSVEWKEDSSNKNPSSSFAIPADQSYPFYWLNLNEVLQGVFVNYKGTDHNVVMSGGKPVVEGVPEAEFVVNVEMLKPVIDSVGNILKEDVEAKDSFGNILYDSDGNAKVIVGGAIMYCDDDSKYFVGGYSTTGSILDAANVSSLYVLSAAGTAGYDSVGMWTNGTNSCFVYNNNIPVKFRVTLRCTVGKHKSEITVFFINRVDSLLLDPTSYDATYEQIFGHGGD